MRFDPADLRLFLNVVLSGSITAGAQRGNLSLAAASTRLRAMEDSLGTPLLERRRRGVEPTAAGRVLENHARQILAQMEAMHSELSEFAGGRRGRVKLLCNTVTLVEYLPQALGPFLATNPDIDVDIEEMPSRRILAAISDGLADIGIAAYAMASARLETLPFRQDRLVLAVHPDHPLAGLEQVSFARVLDYDFVGLGADTAIHDLLTVHAAQAGRTIRFRTRLRTFAGICELAALQVGIAIVPESAARRAALRYPLSVVPLSDSWTSRDLSLCLRRQRSRQPLVNALIDALLRPRDRS